MELLLITILSFKKNQYVFFTLKSILNLETFRLDDKFSLFWSYFEIETHVA